MNNPRAEGSGPRVSPTLPLQERAACYARLVQEPGWELLRQTFRPDIRMRITDTDAREAFVYEAVRAQVIQEIFATPLAVMHQAERERSRRSRRSRSVIDAADRPP